MIIFNVVGLFASLAALALAFVFVYCGRTCGLNVGAEAGLLFGVFSVSCFALVNDRTPAGFAWQTYLNCFTLPSGPSSGGRIAVCGFPLVLSPVVALVFSYLLPDEKKGNALPSTEYYLAMLGISFFVFIGVYMKAVKNDSSEQGKSSQSNLSDEERLNHASVNEPAKRGGESEST